MARKKSWGLRGFLAAFAAVLIALAALPATALAGEATGNREIEISQLQPGDKVSIYKVVTYAYHQETDTYSMSFVDGLAGALSPLTIAKYNDMDNDAAKSVADQMATYMRTLDQSENPNLVTDYPITVSGNSHTATLGIGQYLVLVTPGDNNTSAVYQNALINVEPQYSGGTWSLVANPSALEMKQSKIEVTKTVENADGTQAAITDDFGNMVGDTLKFTASFEIPVYPSDFTDKTLTFSDVMSIGLTFEGEDTVTVALEGGSELDASTYTYNAGSNGFTLAFKYDKITQFAGQKVVVTYEATINENATVRNPETNTATLEYSNGPSTSETSDEVLVYTYGLHLIKVDADNETTQLAGATFNVYKSVEQGTPSAVDLGDGVYGVLVGTITTGDGANGTVLGEAYIEDLGAGTYYLKETAAPDGYQLDQSIHSVEVGPETDGTTAEYVVDTKVSNTKTPSLPVTGGEGTIAITAIGVVLIAGAAALIVRARRQHNN